MAQVVLGVHNVRSAHNVGSLLRTADGLGVSKVYLSGYTPYPIANHDERLPHVAKRAAAQIHKTALGAEDTVKWEHAPQIEDLFIQLKAKDFYLVGLEQTPSAVSLKSFKSRPKTALIVGSEVGGLDDSTLKLLDAHLEIPMRGRKESFNVSIAAAIALYKLTELDK